MREQVLKARERAKIKLTRSPRLYGLSKRAYTTVRFAARKPHEIEYAVFGLFADRKGAFLDVGANAGQSALSFRVFNRSAPIVSIEPNPFHESDLQYAGKLVRGGYRYELIGAGSEPAELTLFVPIYRGVPLTTEASVLREAVTGSSSLRGRLGAGMDGPEFSIEQRTVPIRPLDELGLSPDFVKLDVQGFEFDALKGLEQTLDRSHPVLLIETPDADCKQFLADHGYAPFTFKGGKLEPGAKAVNVVYLHTSDPKYPASA